MQYVIKSMSRMFSAIHFTSWTKKRFNLCAFSMPRLFHQKRPGVTSI